MNINFLLCLLMSKYLNDTFKEKYSKLRYNLSILCHFKVGLILKEAQNANEINFLQ